jgi:hypothetical protein
MRFALIAQRMHSIEVIDAALSAALIPFGDSSKAALNDPAIGRILPRTAVRA